MTSNYQFLTLYTRCPIKAYIQYGCNVIGLVHSVIYFWAFAENGFPYEGNENSQAYVPQSNRFQHPYYSGELDVLLTAAI